jgi:5-methylcytosine-specific restriction endonuclease McrA
MSPSLTTAEILTLRPPAFAPLQRQFVRSVRLAAKGDVTAARLAFDSLDADALSFWFHLTAQNAGRERAAIVERLHGATSRPGTVGRDTQRMPSESKKLKILDRDGHLCRYCGSPLLYGKDFRKLLDIIGVGQSVLGRTNLTTHGTKFLHYATFDHVHPHADSGSSSDENIVSACYACNFGKSTYTLDELAMDEPVLGRFRQDKSWSKIVRSLKEL